MSVEFSPTGAPVADARLRRWREERYKPESLLVGSLLEKTTECIDDIMGRTEAGCSISTDGSVQYHQYDRTLGLALGARFYTQLSVTRMTYTQPRQFVCEQYDLSINHFDYEHEKLLGDSFLLKRYVQCGWSGQSQHSLDHENWPPQPEPMLEGLWQNVTPYEIQQLDTELSRIQRLQSYEDNLAASARAWGEWPSGV